MLVLVVMTVSPLVLVVVVTKVLEWVNVVEPYFVVVAVAVVGTSTSVSQSVSSSSSSSVVVVPP